MDAILKSFAFYGYSLDDVTKLVTFVSDRGPNIRYGLQERGFDLLHCYCHLLNNLTGRMLGIPELQTMLRDANQLCSYIKNTGLNVRLKKTLKTFSKTRWNGACTMLNSLLEADFNLLTEILVEKQRATKTNLVQMVTALNKEEIRPVCDFLTKIKKWSDILEGEIEETLHFVWPAFLSLQKLLEEDIEDDENGFMLVGLMKVEGRAYLNRNMNDFKPKINHKFAVVLHPLMRKLPNIDAYERECVYEQMEAMIKDFSGSDEKTEVDSAPPVVQVTKKTPNTALSAFFEPDLVEQGYNGSENKPTELQSYLNLQIKVNPDNFDIKKWWFDNKHDFPNLARMFSRYSCTPASSAPSERNFSEAGLIITNRRSNLLPTNVSNLIIARNIYKNKN